MTDVREAIKTYKAMRPLAIESPFTTSISCNISFVPKEKKCTFVCENFTFFMTKKYTKKKLFSAKLF